MNLSKIYSCQFDVLKSFIVDVEVDLNKQGLPQFKIVGLPDKAIEEAKERVISAIKNSGFSETPSKFKVTVSLSPSDLRKTGPIFDLPIALGFLLANEEIDFDSENKVFFGELALNGDIRKVSGVLPMVKIAKEKGFKSVYLPEENAKEASYVSGINIFPIKSLKEVFEHLSQEKKKEKNLKKIISKFIISKEEERKVEENENKDKIKFEDIIEQESAKRVLEISAAGGHNVCMYGPAGTGKTMLARAFTTILPKLSEEQALEVTEIHSASGVLENNFIKYPPFRSPHHTASYVSVIGGGSNPKPGEVTLAHRGVLFMDEFVEFDKKVLESLREPLEDNFVNISRSKGTFRFPANFILIAALNPPTEVFRDKFVSFNEEKSFKKKLSGPIMDRIDLWTEVLKIDYKKMSENILDNAKIKTNNNIRTSEEIMNNVVKARKMQKERFGEEKLNSNMNARDIAKFIKLDQETKDILETASKNLNISPRVFHKILKISRTIADLDLDEKIRKKHVLEALQYRPKEII